MEQAAAEKPGGNSSSRNSRQSQGGNTPLYPASAHGLDCLNSVIRNLLYGFDSTTNISIAFLPSWVHIKRQVPPTCIPAVETKAEEPMVCPLTMHFAYFARRSVR